VMKSFNYQLLKIILINENFNNQVVKTDCCIYENRLI
jgi:hypothetical protein